MLYNIFQRRIEGIVVIILRQMYRDASRLFISQLNGQVTSFSRKSIFYRNEISRFPKLKDMFVIT